MEVAPLLACDHCGLVQRLPELPAGSRPVCARCAARLDAWWHDPRLAAALSLSALVLYVPGILLPMMRLESLGHTTESSIIGGVSRRRAPGHVFGWLAILLVWPVL